MGETSRMARRDNAPRRPTQRRRVLVALLECHFTGGLTADELARMTGLYGAVSGSSAAKRLSELKRDGLVEPTPVRRPTRMGSPADVYRLTDAGLREAQKDA